MKTLFFSAAWFGPNLRGLRKNWKNKILKKKGPAAVVLSISKLYQIALRHPVDPWDQELLEKVWKKEKKLFYFPIYLKFLRHFERHPLSFIINVIAINLVDPV